MGNIINPFIKIKNTCIQTITCSNKNKITKHTKRIVCGEGGMEWVMAEIQGTNYI